MGKLDEIRAKKSALAKQIADDGKRLLREAFVEMFDAHPEVKAVRWTQYTPYFNDGDACRFGVHEFRFRLADTAEDAGDYEDGYESAWSLDYAREGTTLPRGRKTLAKALRKFESDVHDSDVLLALFGDHVQVTATRDGFQAEEHSHD